MLLAPSILSADFSALGEDVKKISKADLVHVDIMDGHFVPNISFGAGVMKSLNGKTNLSYDVHLMIENPDDYLEEFVADNTEYIAVHQEACKHLDRTIEHIKSCNVKAGVAINPATPIETIKPILHKVDLIVVMAVNPGFGGQKFIPYTVNKIQDLDKIRKEKSFDYKIEVDGGVTLQNARILIEAGCDILVAGSSVFKSNNIEKTVDEFKRIGNE